MIEGPSSKHIAFVVPTLNKISAQNEDIVQLMLFAATKLEQEIDTQARRSVTATVISIEHDTGGWKNLSDLFSKETLQHISVEQLEDPITPNLAIAGHKAAYNLFEFLKKRTFDEVHCLDRVGLAYYPTQAKLLGLYFLDTVFAIHVVGGTVFRTEVEDKLLDRLGPLMDDMLERGSLERADVIYMHDRKAWRWYLDKIVVRNEAKVVDLAWSQKQLHAAKASQIDPESPLPIIYYGPLGADGGLPLFCDAVGRALPNLADPVEIYFIGSSQAIGGMDAVSYIRLRSAKWGVPVSIKRELSILDEIALLFELGGVVVSHSVRRESLRSRLIAGSGLTVLQVNQAPGPRPTPADAGYLAIPGRIAQALVDELATKTVRVSLVGPALLDLWRRGRPHLETLEDILSSHPLQLPGDDQPRVSVCVTHFSRPEKLRIALASLKQQTYRNFEVIVIDDGSPDPEVKRELSNIKREIEPLGWRLLVQENRYLGAARNFGASLATGDYLIFMDDDNAAKPSEISVLVAVAQRTGAELVTTFYDAFETALDLESPTPALRFTPFGSDPLLGVLTNCYGDANALYHRQIFEQLGGFTEDYGITHEDWEFFCRASLKGVKLICVPEPLFWYRVDPQGMFRGEQTQLHKSANLRRHIRPFLETLPYYQAKLVQLAQGLAAELPLTTVGEQTRLGAPAALKDRQSWLPYARVAIITRTKDRPLLLRRAIRGMLNQTFKDWLLVIVNDGGSPESIELVVDEVADELAGRVSVLQHPVSLGMQTAANAGLSRCDSDFIIIHDDDDSWAPTFLARTVSHLDENGWNPKIGGVITWSHVIVEEIDWQGEVKQHNQFIFNDKLRHISLVDMAIENRFPPISFLFRRAALDVVGPFKEQHGVLGDWEFHLRMLRQFDINVIPEPLANYHHRTQSTVGIYGNSVHVQNDEHRLKRTQLINGVVRGQMVGEDGLSLAQLLSLGELHHTLLAEQSQEFQRLHDYIWTIEQRVRYISSQFDSPTLTKSQQNFVLNGDFRLWPGLGKIEKGEGDSYDFLEICPGYALCYDGHQVSYQVEQRQWTEDGQRLPFGKTYLHLENEGITQAGSWFTLECLIPSVSLLSGQAITLSGMCRLIGARDWILVGGRYDLGEGRHFTWPNQRVFVPADFEWWSYSMTCPAVQETSLKRGHSARLFLMFPHNQPFEFDLTNLQVGLGPHASPFEYNGTLSLRQRFSVLQSGIGTWIDKMARVIIGTKNKGGAEADSTQNSDARGRENIVARKNL